MADLTEADRIFELPLPERGFTPLPHHQDHVPAGQDDDLARRPKRFRQRSSRPAPDVNPHARLPGSPNERLAPLFRNRFHAHPQTIPAHAHSKRLLPPAVTSPGTSAEINDPVADPTVAAAEPRAAATGRTPHGHTATAPREKAGRRHCHGSAALLPSRPAAVRFGGTPETAGRGATDRDGAARDTSPGRAGAPPLAMSGSSISMLGHPPPATRPTDEAPVVEA
ncbi:hypothetical protein F4556_007381 [Kitasatospora gansuensis]|uniref:Uncharacterized protein n=1 Tax=Kitasatospora gansuensis TaxID=258050 RepID=A0A7W7SJX9_9ACTN|nr:hypothetical protein [Kitasatospora gansuensis]MBB4944486.1 hypothetical protein [Kitasatospora gansuensis]MBB4951846.1 hypothetical protein [Kitasatospora gansuensis]